MVAPAPSIPSRYYQQLRRIALVLLVLFSFAAAQTTDAIVDHHVHDGSSHHDCPGCHSGHFSVLPAVSSMQLSALALARWRNLPDQAAPVVEAGSFSRSPRGPPTV